MQRKEIDPEHYCLSGSGNELIYDGPFISDISLLLKQHPHITSVFFNLAFSESELEIEKSPERFDLRKRKIKFTLKNMKEDTTLTQLVKHFIFHDLCLINCELSENQATLLSQRKSLVKLTIKNSETENISAHIIKILTGSTSIKSLVLPTYTPDAETIAYLSNQNALQKIGLKAATDKDLSALTEKPTLTALRLEKITETQIQIVMAWENLRRLYLGAFEAQDLMQQNKLLLQLLSHLSLRILTVDDTQSRLFYWHKEKFSYCFEQNQSLHRFKLNFKNDTARLAPYSYFFNTNIARDSKTGASATSSKQEVVDKKAASLSK